MEVTPYSFPQPEPEPLFGGATPRDEQLQQQKLPEMEINVDRVMEDIKNFNGTPEEAQVLTNLYIGSKTGTIPKNEDYNANVNSYMYQGASDNDPIKNLEHIKKGFTPEEDKAYTQLQDFEALSPEEQWNKIKPAPMAGGNVAIGATMPAMIPQKYKRPQEVFFSDSEKKKNINDHINKLKSKSRTWKLEQGRGFSDKAKSMVNKMVMTKQPPNLFEYLSLDDKEKNSFFTYASGRNPKYDVGFFEAMGGTIKQTAVDIKDSFRKTGESIIRSELGIEDTEEFFLRFNAKFGDTFDAKNVTDDKRKEIHNWVIDQLQPTMDDALVIGEAYTQKTYDTANEIMSQLDEYLAVGAESRMQKKLESKTKAATRHAYKTGLVGDTLLTATEMGMDLGAVAALSVGTMGFGGMAYSAGRFYGDYEDSLLQAGVDPEKARVTSLLTAIPYVLVEQLQAGQVFGKQFKGIANKVVDDLEIGKIATKAIKDSSNPKISKIATGARMTADYIDNVSAELVEEIVQEVFSEVGKHSAIEGYELEESIGNVIETAKQAFKGLIVLGAGTPLYKGIKGGYDGDFIEQDISNTIEETFDPLTTQEQDLAALDRLRQEEYEAAEDKEAYLEQQDFSPREREIIETTQDIKQEEVQRKLQEVDEREAREGTSTLEDRAAELKPHANIVEEGNGIRVTTDAGIDFRVEFDEGLQTAGEYDPSIATIKLNPNTGQPTIDHEKVHLFKNIGLITDKEFNNLQAKAEEYFGKDEVNRIREENIKGYAKKGHVATEEILSEEIVANYFEDLSLKKDIPEDVRNIFQKILDFIKESLKQYIETSVSGDKMIKLIQSGEIIKRKPIRNGAKKMQRAAKRREEAQEQGKKDFIKSALTEAEANNKELVSAIETLSRLEVISDKLSPQERVDQATGVSKSEGMRAEDFITGDEIIEGQLPGDFFQSEQEGAGLTGEDLYSYGETIQNPILEFIEENGGIARTPEIEQEIKNRFGDMVATKRYVNKNGALDWDQMASLLSTEPSSPLFEREVTKDDILDYIGQDSETKFSIAPRTDSKGKNLITLHNLSAENLKFVEELGGLPAPSVAIARSDIGFDSFGEISLVGGPDIVDTSKDKTAKTFDADIYSPRQPRATFDVDLKKLHKMKDSIQEEINILGDYFNPRFEDYGFNEVAHIDAVKLKFLRETGKIKRLPKNKPIKMDKAIVNMVKDAGVNEIEEISKTDKFRDLVKKTRAEGVDIIEGREAKIKENPKMAAPYGRMIERKYFDIAVMASVANKPAKIDKKAIRKKLNDVKTEKVLEWAKEYFDNPIKNKRLYSGTDSMGRQKYINYTIDNVVKKMLAKPLRGGEGYNYGVGNIRAQAARQLKSKSKVQERRDFIKSKKEVEAFKEESSKKFSDLAEYLKPFYKYDTESFNYFEGIAEALGDYASRGRSQDLKPLDSEAKNKINGFINYLKDAPTEYFESKIQRVVTLDEFEAALIPRGAKYNESAEILKNHGLRIIRFNEGEGRNLEDKRLSKLRYSLSPRSERDAVTVLANAIITGKAKTLAQREQILNSYKIPLKNQEAIKERAFNIAEQVQSEIDSLENTQTIRNAIRKAEIKQFYDAERKAILEKGIEQGELLEMARARLKEDRKKLKEATKQQQEPLPKMDEKVRSINDEMAMLKVVDDIVNDTRKKVFPKKEPKNWQRDPRILGTIRESVKSASNYLLKNVAPGADKQKLQQQIKELSDKATYRGLRSASEKVLNNILDKASKTTRKEVQKKLKNTLKNYSSEPPARVEARKRTMEGQRHWFLYHGNKALKMGKEEFQREMKAAELEMKEHIDSDNPMADDFFLDAEIKYRAYMTFGGLGKKDASIPDIVSAQEYAEKVIADGKAFVEKLQEAHNEKYAETTQAIIDAVLAAKPYVKKVDDPSKISQLFDFFKTMNVREQLEYITEYGSDQEKSLLKKILDFNGTSKIKKKTRILEMNRKLEKIAQDLGIKNIENYALDRSKLEKKFRKYSHEGRTDMSRANLMQLYMTFRQPDVIEMASRVNNDGELINPDLYKRLQQMPEIRKELTDQEMRLADAMGDLISEMLPDINKAYKKQYGINMKVQPENYWSLRVQVKSAGYESVMATVSEAPGFTIQRVAHRNDLDERADIFEVYYGHIADAAHYIETIDSQLAIRSTLTNRNFKEAVRQTYGKETLKQVDGSIVDMAIDRALNPDTGIAIIDFVRSVMSTISIGYNPKSLLVAATGAVNIFTTHKGMFRTIGAIAKNPDQYKKNISTVLNSAVVQERLKQGLNEQMRNARERAKANKAVKTYVDMGFYPLSWVDSRVAALAGGAIYTEFQNSEAAAGLTPQEIETQGLALVDYAIQKAYQPTDPDMLPSAIRRGGSVIKAIFQFKTEPMSKLGLYAKDWNAAKVMWQKGKKDEAVKKALKIVIGQHIVIPAAYWMAGEIMRLGEDDDWEERLDRLAVHIMVGPMSGLLLVGTGIEIAAKHIVGEKIYLGSSTPSDRVINEVKFLLDRATNWEDEEIDETILKIIKQYNPAVKNTLEIIED